MANAIHVWAEQDFAFIPLPRRPLYAPKFFSTMLVDHLKQGGGKKGEISLAHVLSATILRYLLWQAYKALWDKVIHLHDYLDTVIMTDSVKIFHVLCCLVASVSEKGILVTYAHPSLLKLTRGTWLDCS